VVTAGYAAVCYWGAALPAASSFVGHSIGVAGFVFMLMTETLYSIRKRLTVARWGSMAAWLRSHVVMGLVGPYMVFLHAAMRFQGLAGVLMLLTGVVVASGLVGRYLYTRVARDESTARQREVLATWRTLHVPLTWMLFALAFVHVLATLYYVTLAR
jgi:cytochrome b561